MSTILALAAVVAILGSSIAPQASAAPRAFFVFGDSLVDNGNNNYLATTARADSPPYGVDYPTRRPTGRFSNGYNIPDFISQSLGAESTLPYLSPELQGERLLVGANFASAGIGVLNDTGIQFVNIIRMFQQYQYFEQYQQRVAALIGEEQAQQLVNQALVLITVGGNDFVNNYYLVPFSARSRQYSLPDYVVYVISEYKKLLQMLGELNSELGGDIFIAANTAMMTNDFVSNPAAFGFVTSKVACCGQGPYNGLGLCTPASNLCPNRDVYAFWDAFHPSERANGFIVQQILNGSPEVMSPMNLSTILAMDSRNN
ncbi:GDSL esterase/lipase LTL1 [Linum perenne]